MQEPKNRADQILYPNNVRQCIKRQGYTLQEVADEIGIARRTLTNYVAGIVPIPRKCLEKIADVIGCDIQDLVSQYNTQDNTSKQSGLRQYMTNGKKPLPPVVSNGLFQIGNLQGTWFPLDGDGTIEYRLEHITTHYISSPEALPEELQKRREEITQEQQKRKAQGLSFAWNGGTYNLDHFVIGREPVDEEMTLDLWFRPSDYYTFLATNKSLDDPAIRMKYLQEPNWYEPVPFFSHSFGIALVIVAKDGYCLPAQRSPYQAIHANLYSAATVVESLSRPVDKRTDSFAPDIYRCACRGLYEELGLIEHVDFFPKDVLFLNFGVNTTNALWAFRGMVKVQRTCQEILDKWSKGVKDKLENQRLFPLPFTPDEYIQFITQHKIAGESLYYALVHEFGRARVEDAFDSISFKESLVDPAVPIQDCAQ